MSDSAREVQHDGTCPDCGRFAQIGCSVHGPLDGDPWAEVERLQGERDRALDLLRRLVAWADDGMAAARNPDVEALNAAYALVADTANNGAPT